jgi:hypothetical protein
MELKQANVDDLAPYCVKGSNILTKIASLRPNEEPLLVFEFSRCSSVERSSKPFSVRLRLKTYWRNSIYGRHIQDQPDGTNKCCPFFSERDLVSYWSAHFTG